MSIPYNFTEGDEPLPYDLFCQSTTQAVHMGSKPAPELFNQGSNGKEWPVSIPYKFTEGVKPLPYELLCRTKRLIPTVRVFG